ncbi:hypothetical protein BJY21_004187 [Kineosphaera limosa]|uniref:YaaA family protein n=1 Tax=Kineosphaera limosa TaxID=111564 RepID=UPI000310930B|nr:peroxide stress protein YaaA [Kineosphaera limosa]NYE03003.1 hypothetical protein [Kineosphaera limosa]
MLVLLPPSQSKSVRRRGAPMRPDRLSFPQLAATRDRVAHALGQVGGGVEGARLLGLPHTLADQVDLNTRLQRSPAVPVSALYTGVLYDALEVASLTGPAKARATRWLVVVSALYGGLRMRDAVGPYRLSMSTTVPGLPPLARLWRPALAQALGAAAGRGLIVDGRSSDYVAAWKPAGEQATRWVHIAVPGATHGAKHTRGLVARAICEHGLDARTPVALARDLAQVTQGRLGVDLDEPARAGAPWQLRVTHKVW